ncbi:hypothetical protein M1L60_41430 [Actinoplanes sp. TRM 88003]|uniref:YcaO domain-containing protein n=1 Tax=Paractinoplanes aksuensis TaxID=2939490 RepID=A0ABT1E1Q0_9ACTN|nr:hypothetical protein [Actinoplanes aksuensis]MCO8277059.1 hypothetical protein [Actinoplanes aksuensis]
MFDRFRRNPAPKPDDQYLELRGMILRTTPAEVGVAPTSELPRVWGLVMDTTWKKGGYTLVALADGTTSLYTSTGGGFIGCGEHPQVAEATRDALRVVEEHLDHLSPSIDASLPPAGEVVLRALAYSGEHALRAPENDLGKGRHPQSPIFHAAQNVITYVRLLQESR